MPGAWPCFTDGLVKLCHRDGHAIGPAMIMASRHGMER